MADTKAVSGNKMRGEDPSAAVRDAEGTYSDAVEKIAVEERLTTAVMPKGVDPSPFVIKGG